MADQPSVRLHAATIPTLLILFLLSALTGCGPGHGALSLGLTTLSSDGSYGAAADSTDFAASLAAHQDLPSDIRSARRAEAEAGLSDWHRFEQEAFREKDSRLRHWYYRDDAVTVDYLGVGVGNAIVDLKAAGGIDPSFAEAWANLGRLCGEVGDWPSARKYLERAMLAAAAEAEAGQPVARELVLDIHRDLAWTYRDLALWDEGLETVAAGLALRPADEELLLIKGLLLAGSGRFSEAISHAVRMPPLSYPQYDFLFRGLRRQTSGFANGWIKSQAFLAIGDLNQAYRMLGDLPTFAYRSVIPFGPRYWRDAGLVAELHDDPQAPIYYAVGHVVRDYLQFYPVLAQNVAPQVLDLPHARSPVFTSYGSRFYCGGSPLSYVGLQMNLMATALFPGQRSEAAGRALLMLEILARRGIRPDVCHALRGRVYYVNDDFAQAREELAAAHAAFAAAGEVDPGTSLLLGLLQMQVADYAAAEPFLLETTKAAPDNPIAWRSLGIARIKAGRPESALPALDRAVAVDPWSVASFYNRGLYHLQNKDFARARNDLERALSLEPDNREVQRLLQMTVVAGRGGDSAELPVVARTEGPPAGATGDPADMLARLEAEVEAVFDLPDSLRATGPEADARLGELETRFVRSGSPELRAMLALAYIDRRRFLDVQDLLAASWGVDLTPNEELMLLFADRQLGEMARAEQVVQDVLASGSGAGNPYAVALAVRSLQTGVDPVGEDFKAPGFHGFFGWWRDARFNYGQDVVGRPRFAVDAALMRRYMADPMFEQAVWGMTQTPLAGRQNSVPNDMTAGKN